MERERCPWCLKDDIYKDYHDRIWGRPEHDDAKLFEKLCLDGAQSYRKAFDGWDAEKIACYDEKKIMQLMKDPGIIRNRLKIQGVVKNANAYLRIKEQGSFSDHLWNYVDHTPQVNQWTSISQVPATSSISDALSKDLKKAEFSFVGSTFVYAFMQAVGMVDDHLVTCWRRNERK